MPEYQSFNIYSITLLCNPTYWIERMYQIKPLIASKCQLVMSTGLHGNGLWSVGSQKYQNIKKILVPASAVSKWHMLWAMTFYFKHQI